MKTLYRLAKARCGEGAWSPAAEAVDRALTLKGGESLVKVAKKLTY